MPPMPIQLARRQIKYARDAAASPKDKEEADEMPDQLGPGHGNACRSDKLGHAAIKLRGLKLKPEEICVVREEKGLDRP
jgi:hypothetical protein